MFLWKIIAKDFYGLCKDWCGANRGQILKPLCIFLMKSNDSLEGLERTPTLDKPQWYIKR